MAEALWRKVLAMSAARDQHDAVNRVSLPVELLRAIDSVVFPIGLLWIMSDGKRKSLQDIVFRTGVVYSRPRQCPNRSPGGSSSIWN